MKTIKQVIKKCLKWKCECTLFLLLVIVLVIKLYRNREDFQDNTPDNMPNTYDNFYNVNNAISPVTYRPDPNNTPNNMQRHTLIRNLHIWASDDIPLNFNLIKYIDGDIRIGEIYLRLSIHNTTRWDPIVEKISKFRDLSFMSNIEAIYGTLNISENHLLRNINGLSNLTYVGGDLEIYHNRSLTNLDGLSNLREVGRDIKIGKEIPNVSELNDGAWRNMLRAFNQNSLTNIDGLSGLTRIAGNLEIMHNTSLTNLDGLSNITRIEGNLVIAFNPSLTNLNGLLNITHIGGYVNMLFNGHNGDLTVPENVRNATNDCRGC